jgi:tetratricopeptide (TPR) repeat protein
VPLADGTYRLDGLVRDAPAIRRRLDRPLVGRGRELDALRAAHARASDERAWVLVTVLGEPGIGKSRLAAELPAALPAAATVLQGRCPPYGEGTTYRPLRDVVVQACGGNSLAETAARLGLGSDVAECVAATVGLAPGSAGEEAAWAFREFLGACSRELPVAVVIDDVHWAEAGLLEFLDAVTASSSAGPGLLVCLARPELRESRPEWAQDSGRRILLELGPLSAAESRRLLADAGGRLAAGDRERIAATAAGNPLFLEQLATYIGERHGSGDDLPPAVRSLLAARLDLLAPAERAVLCYGSIQGDGFTAGSLHALAQGAPLAEIEGACEALVWRDLLVGGETLAFRHGLVRETAYDALSKAARARLHERHATWLAALADPPPDTDARIGHQLEAAYRWVCDIGAPGRAELAVRARGALANAARLAHRRGDLRGEIGLLERAIRFTEAPPIERAELLPALAAALFAAGSFDRATEIAEEAVRAASELAAPVVHARALVERERLRVYQGQATIDIDASLRVVDRSLEALTGLGDDLGAARAHYLRCELVWMGGDPEAGSASAERMLECARRAGSGFEASAAIGYMAWSLVQGVTPVSAALERCAELEASLAGDRVARLEVAGYRGVLLAMAGRLDPARREMAASRGGLAELGLRQACAYMALFDAQLEMLAGDAPAAERAARDAERITAETGDRWFQATVRVDLALTLLAQAAGPEAQAAVRAIDAIPAPADAEWVLKRHRARALLAASTDDLDHAMREGRAATAAAAGTNLIGFRGDAHRTLAEVLVLAGDDDGAAGAAEEALRLYEAKENAASAAHARRLLAEVGVTRH